jgi:hypothetical protein
VGAADYRMVEVESFDRMWRLPAGGFGNGLDDASWAAVVDVSDEPVAHEVLDKTFAAGVPAYATALPRLETVGPHSRHRVGIAASVRIWLGATRYGKGRDVLLGLLPRLVDEHGQDVIR